MTKAVAKGRSVWYKIVAFTFVGVLISMLTAASASYIPPYIFWWPALAGLAFPFILLVMIVYAFYWIATAHYKTFGVTLVVIAITFPIWSHYFAYHNGRTTLPTKTRTFKIMSYNVRNFDLYNWSHNTETRHKLLALIAKENPDILCLQEFFTHDNDTAYDNIRALRQLGYRYYHFNNGATIRQTEHWGVATFSRYPIVQKNEIVFAGQLHVNGCIVDDIRLRDTIITVFNMQLQSIHLNDKDYASIDKIAPSSQDSRKKLWLVGGKMRKAFVIRAHQVDTISTYIANATHPVIACGDFNDTPSSYTYHTLRYGLKDAFLDAGFGMGKTYIGPVPSFRIDYILHSNLLKVYSYATLHTSLSDHNPVVAVMYR